MTGPIVRSRSDGEGVPTAIVLPAAAARWLGRSVPTGTRVPSAISIEQRGSMEANDRWLKFTARGTYQVRPLAFEWRARLRVLPALWVIARDGHDGAEGWGGAWLMGLKRINERRGPEVLPMQLIRNVAELVYLPDMAQAAETLRWSEGDGGGADSFVIGRDVGTSEVIVRFEVDPAGDVVRASSPARPIDGPEGFEEVPWRCDYGGHREFDGIRIPTTVVATYEFEDDPWEYFRGEVHSVARTFE